MIKTMKVTLPTKLERMDSVVVRDNKSNIGLQIIVGDGLVETKNMLQKKT